MSHQWIKSVKLGMTFESWQILNGDEIGIGPEGKWKRLEVFDGVQV